MDFVPTIPILQYSNIPFPPATGKEDKTMRRSELFSLWFFLSLSLVSFSALFPPMAGAVTVGFYAGTFDPPTRREMVMVRCAFGDASVHSVLSTSLKTDFL